MDALRYVWLHVIPPLTPRCARVPPDRRSCSVRRFHRPCRSWPPSSWRTTSGSASAVSAAQLRPSNSASCWRPTTSSTSWSCWVMRSHPRARAHARWCLSRRSPPRGGSPSSSANPRSSTAGSSSPPPRSTAIDPSPSVRPRCRSSATARCRCWWRQTLPRVASTSRASSTS